MLHRLASSFSRVNQLNRVTKRFASTEAPKSDPTKVNPMFFEQKNRFKTQNLAMMTIFVGMTAYSIMNYNLTNEDVVIVKKPYSD